MRRQEGEQWGEGLVRGSLGPGQLVPAEEEAEGEQWGGGLVRGSVRPGQLLPAGERREWLVRGSDDPHCLAVTLCQFLPAAQGTGGRERGGRVRGSVRPGQLFRAVGRRGWLVRDSDNPHCLAVTLCQFLPKE